MVDKPTDDELRKFFFEKYEDERFMRDAIDELFADKAYGVIFVAIPQTGETAMEYRAMSREKCPHHFAVMVAHLVGGYLKHFFGQMVVPEDIAVEDAQKAVINTFLKTFGFEFRKFLNGGDVRGFGSEYSDDEWDKFTPEGD